MHSITIKDEELPIVVRKHKRARRITIRYRPLTHALQLTLPRRASLRQGLHFIEQKREWIARQLEHRPLTVPFADGQAISVFGKTYALRHVGGRGVVRIENEHILVPGDAAFMARRVRDFLMVHARAEITRLVHDKAGILGKSTGKISLRDTVSCWGSCNKAGNLSFSWRLIFAPYDVLEYVVCHEVAHLAELNHSPRFWKQVMALCPEYQIRQRWLKKHGATLYRFC